MLEPPSERSYLEQMDYYERLDQFVHELGPQLERGQWTGLFAEEVRMLLREWRSLRSPRG